MVEKTLNDRQFEFELVAPEKVEVASLEERVLLPGEMGDFMVMAGHTPLLAGLRAGVVTVHKNIGDVHYFITGGLADVGNAHCIVLTPHIVPVTALKQEKIANDLQKIEQELTEAKDKHVQDHLKEQVEILHLKLEVAKKYNAN